LALEDTTYAFLADSSLHVSFLDSIEGQHKREREALIAFYNALDGDNWTDNTNWCSDKPLSEWEGILADGPHGFVSHIIFTNSNNFNGTIPKDIRKLEYLQTVILYESNEGRGFHGVIPEELFASKYLQEVTINSPMTPYNIVQLPEYMPSLVGLNICCTEIKFPYSIKGYQSLEGLSLNYTKVGKLPDDLGDLKKLKYITITNCDITSLPNSIGQLTQLKQLDLGWNQLTGEFPESLLSLKNLQLLCLNDNNLSGSIPSEVANMMDSIVQLGNGTQSWFFDLRNNNFTGTIPKEVYEHPNWKYVWSNFYEGNNFNIHDIPIPAPDIEGYDIYGDTVDFNALLKSKPYTILYQYPIDFEDADFLFPNIQSVKSVYEKYAESLNFIFWAPESNTHNEIKDFVKKYAHIDWIICKADMFVDSTTMMINRGSYYPMNTYPYLCLIDSTGSIILTSTNLTDAGYQYDIMYFLFDKIITGVDFDYSTDFSAHKQVDTLQLATVGKGIDIVLMGDAYTDRQIADSTYHKDMVYLYEQIFTEEPYKSFKEMFNVYYVNVVSYTEGYEKLSSALGGVFGEKTQIWGNNEGVIQYARCAISDERLDEAMIIVAMNSNRYAGTCYLYDPTYSNDNYGSGLSISYFPKGGDATTFAQLLHHEALGHGFAKLADEYANEENGVILPETKDLYQEQQSQWGRYKNVDFTSDSTQVLWSKLLFDDRYQYDGLGVFEGGLTYWTGVWRPTENSIMRYNTGGFNAPSREAIYYRIHKLAYGDEWEYDYEKFVEWDACNRSTAAVTRGVPYRLDIPEDFKPLHAPVVMNTSWRNAKNNTPAKKTVAPSGNAGRNSKKVSSSSVSAPKSMTTITTVALPDGTTRTITREASGATITTYSK
jgi:hypothetical protein